MATTLWVLKMGLDPARQLLYILDVVRGQWSPAEVELKIMATARWDGVETTIRPPKEPGGAGKFQAMQLGRQTPRAGRWSPSPRRAPRAIALIRLRRSANTVLSSLSKPDWNKAFIDELCAFDNGAYDDQVDAAAAAFRGLTRASRWAAA